MTVRTNNWWQVVCSSNFPLPLRGVSRTPSEGLDPPRQPGACPRAVCETRPEVCGALNVTVSPGPVVDYLEGENATLLCHVSQKRRKDSLLAVRWFFARPDSQEALMVKMTKLRVVQYYGNYSRSAFRQRLCLLEERRGALYTLSVLTLRPADQGHYVCKVQEISKHRNKWTAWSNGSSATEMRVISLKASEDASFEKKKETWAFFEDLYIYAVLVCCVGILSVLLFTLTIVWQSVFSKRKARARHYLVKCPQNSSGETVTSVTSLAPLQPKKGKRRKEKADVPPAVPAKAPIAATFHKPKLLKPQRKVTLSRSWNLQSVCGVNGRLKTEICDRSSESSLLKVPSTD
uniref:V-set and transmembrane domain-containing protein 4 n=1 Tax=Ursus maritimus TaxID=29073 RepID=A0A384CJ03_URSMA